MGGGGIDGDRAVYFEKPRTVTAWRGLINDPGMDGSFDVHRGLQTARRLLLDIVGSGSRRSSPGSRGGRRAPRLGSDARSSGASELCRVLCGQGPGAPISPQPADSIPKIKFKIWRVYPLEYATLEVE